MAKDAQTKTPIQAQTPSGSAAGAEIKEYIRPVPAIWWLRKPAYTRFIVRELTSVFIAGYAVFLMALMHRAKDVAAFHELFERLKSPLSIALHLVVLFFALFHSITFFNLTPRVLVVRRGEEKLPDSAISGAHYVAWLLVSAVLIALALRR